MENGGTISTGTKLAPKSEPVIRRGPEWILSAKLAYIRHASQYQTYLYDRFLDHVEDETARDVPDLMATSIMMHSSTEKLNSPTGSTRFDIFLRRLPQIEIVIFIPFC